MATSKYNLPIEQACHTPSVERRKIRTTTPAYVLDTYPQYHNFLKAYYEYLDQTGGIAQKIRSLRGSRDAVVSSYASSLLKEFGENFPNVTTISNDVLLKILKLFYISKGNEESIKAYFKLFLNDQNARVVYPKENMLRCDDGDWDDANSVFTTVKGFLDESTIVLQDDDYYQIYSYVIKSGQSVTSWGSAFEEAVHPLGWKYFGEVELVGLAKFRVGGLSPLFVPGSQELTEELSLKLTSSAAHDEQGISTTIKITNVGYAEEGYNSLSLGYNILGAQGLTVGDLAAFTIGELTTTAVATTVRRGATVTIS